MLFLAALESIEPDALRNSLALLRAVRLYTLGIERIDQSGRYLAGLMYGPIETLAVSTEDLTRGKRIHDGLAVNATVQLKKLGRVLKYYSTGRTQHLIRAIEREREILQDVGDDRLRRQMLEVLAEMAEILKKQRGDHRAIARAVLRKCARHYRIEIEMVAEDAVEVMVADAFLEQVIQYLQQRLAEGGVDEGELERLLDAEIARMAEGDIIAMCQAMSMDNLTGASLLEALRKGGLTMVGLTSLGAAGIGSYLALSTFVKAFTLLVGMTAPFGVYAGAATALGILLSPVGILTAAAVAVTPVTLRTRDALNCALLASVVAACHAHLHQQGRASKYPGE